MKSIKIDEFENFKFLGNLHLSKNEKMVILRLEISDRAKSV